jgi:hypothetical protein
MKNGNWKTTVPFKEIYDKKEEYDKYMTEEKDIGIVLFFNTRHYWTLFSAGFFGCCKCCKDKFSGLYAEIDPVD